MNICFRKALQKTKVMVVMCKPYRSNPKESAVNNIFETLEFSIALKRKSLFIQVNVMLPLAAIAVIAAIAFTGVVGSGAF